MSASHSKTVSNTHCYVYDPTSHEECDMEDSSRTQQRNKAASTDRTSSSKSGQQTTGGHSDSSKNDRQNRGNDSSSSKQTSSLVAVDRSKPARGKSTSQTSKDVGKDAMPADFIVLSDDSESSPPSRRSRREHQRPRRSRSRSRSDRPEVKDLRWKITGDLRYKISDLNSEHRIEVHDHRYGYHRTMERRSSSRGRRSHSRDKHSLTGRSSHRSRSRSVDRKRRHSRSSERRHDCNPRHSSPASERRSQRSETEELKERIEKLKEEISRTKMQKDVYIYRDDHIRDDPVIPVPPPQSLPPPASYVPRERFQPQADDGVSHSNNVLPPQLVEHSHSVPDHGPRDYREANTLRDQQPVVDCKQETHAEPSHR